MENEDILNLDTVSVWSIESARPRCSIADMDSQFVEFLSAAWRIYPFKVISAYRSPAWEHAHGRKGTSAHCAGKAVDIAVRDSRERFYVLDSLRRVGFTRIGIGKTFIHVDSDVNETRPANCIFLEF